MKSEVDQLTEILGTDNWMFDGYYHKPLDPGYPQESLLGWLDRISYARGCFLEGQKELGGVLSISLKEVTLPRGRSYPTSYAQFLLAPFPGCCGIVVSTASFVNPSFRGRGLNTLLNLKRQDVGRWLGYPLMMCTDVLTNIPQLKTLQKNGWTQLHSFTNSRTTNEVGIHVISL